MNPETQEGAERAESLEALGLTEETLKAASESEKAPEATEEQKRAYKEVLRYRNSDNFARIVAHYEAEAEKSLDKIKQTLNARKKIELTVSDLIKVNMAANLLSGLIELIDDSEGGKLLKDYFQEQVQRALTHVYGKVEVGFDAPMYTKLDLMKDVRNFALTTEARLDQAINSFNYVKPAAGEPMHPYET